MSQDEAGEMGEQQQKKTSKRGNEKRRCVVRAFLSEHQRRRDGIFDVSKEDASVMQEDEYEQEQEAQFGKGCTRGTGGCVVVKRAVKVPINGSGTNTGEAQPVGRKIVGSVRFTETESDAGDNIEFSGNFMQRY